jgi:nickel-type superoxide dismutase maturation protease
MRVPPSDQPSGSQTYHRLKNGVAGVAVSAGVLAAALRWRPFRVEVEGASMLPALFPGDWALAVAARRIRRGDVVVVEHPGRPGYEMVKRVAHVPGDHVGDRLLHPGEYWVLGDRPDTSTDSRHFGPVLRERIKAKVLLVYWPADRRRLVR